MSPYALRKLLIASVAASALALPCAVPAQQKKAPADDKPAIATTPDMPAVRTTPPAGKPPAKATTNNGTTIIGEVESPIGLYITPWRDAAAEVNIDRPARLLSVGLDRLDRKVFTRQIDYYDALTAAQKAKAASGTPAAP